MIAIGLANGANQFLLSFVSTIIIVLFLFIRNYFKNKKSDEVNFDSDYNIISINISNNAKSIDFIINDLKDDVKFLKLKSVNIQESKSNYIFWYELDNDKVMSLLNKISVHCNKDINISIYSKSGAFE